MYYYIGIDVSKKVLLFSSLVILFEATGIYSYHLKAFCAENNIKAYIINPQASHNFAKSLGARSKTDTIYADFILY